MMRGLAAIAGAIAMAVGMLVLGRAPALAHSLTAAPAELLHSTGSGVILSSVDASAAQDNSSDDTPPSDRDIAQRRHEYAGAFAISAAILFLAIVVALVLRHRGAAAAGIAALAALGIGALLQFTASRGLPMFLWPPPHLWLGTFAADFMLAVMVAAVAGTMLRPGTRRVMGSIVIAEIAWWGIPACAGAVGLTLSIARQRMEVNWLVFIGTAVGAAAAPAAAWATASLASAIAERMTLSRT
ncbi:MAG TPA: hypothetical protein VMI09_08975 [Candidatus Binataceae bacterium]|nr:hypothetical protein [Candidatus Binataceae bacterium]